METDAVRVILRQQEELKDYRDEWESITRWALGELLHALLDHPFTPAEDVIESFIQKMAFYAADGSRTAWIFSTAAQTAQNTLLEITERRM